MHNKDEQYFLNYKLDKELDKRVIDEQRRIMINAWSVVMGMAILLGTIVVLFIYS